MKLKPSLPGFYILLLVFAIIGFGIWLNRLNNRLSLVEKKLGGEKRLTCDEQETIAKLRKSTVRVVGGISEGSGFFIKASGMVLTNFHVIEFEPNPKVILPDHTFEPAEIILADKASDLAFLKIKRENVSQVNWGKVEELKPGEQLLSFGFPLGTDLPGEATVVKGSFSANRHSKDTGLDYLQTDASLNSGTSGGPMTNVCGEMVGVNVAGLAGLGLAIAENSVQQKWLEMATAKDPLKDVKRITFEPNAGPKKTVEAFYNYLKARKLKEAYGLISQEILHGESFENWTAGYKNTLDVSIIEIKEVSSKKGTVFIKIFSKDLIGDEVKYRYFEGEWQVKTEGQNLELSSASIKEVENPPYDWFSPSQ